VDIHSVQHHDLYPRNKTKWEVDTCSRHMLEQRKYIFEKSTLRVHTVQLKNMNQPKCIYSFDGIIKIYKTYIKCVFRRSEDIRTRINIFWAH
jgi:hypothetical protein